MRQYFIKHTSGAMLEANSGSHSFPTDPSGRRRFLEPIVRDNFTFLFFVPSGIPTHRVDVFPPNFSRQKAHSESAVNAATRKWNNSHFHVTRQLDTSRTIYCDNKHSPPVLQKEEKLITPLTDVIFASLENSTLPILINSSVEEVTISQRGRSASCENPERLSK